MSIAGGIFFLLLLGYSVLQNKQLQRSVVDQITHSLSSQVGSEVDIEEIEWNFPNSFVLKNVYIEDLQKDTLLYVNRTKVTINLLQLLYSKISFRTIQFTGLDAKLSVDSTDTPNFQFFIEAFKPEKNDTLRFQWTMDIESAAFEDCAISFKNPYKEKLIGRYNPFDTYLYDINGFIYVRSFLKKETSILVEDISFKEKSGLVVENISTSISANEEDLSVQNLMMKTPNSNLNINRAVVYHDQYQAFKQPMEKLRGGVEISNTTLQPSDFSVFWPNLDLLQDPLEISGKFYGLLSEFQVEDLLLKYKDVSCVSGSVFVKDLLPEPKNVSISGYVDRISSNAEELGEILFVAMNREILLSEKLDSLGVFAYQGSLDGTLSKMVSNGNVTSNLGVLDLSVVLSSSDRQLKSYKVDGKIGSKNCHLERLLGAKSELGNFSFDLNIMLEKFADRDFSLTAKGVVDSLYYKNYCYQNMMMNGVFDKEGFDGSVIVSDKNVEMSFEGKVDLQKEEPLFHFSSNVSNVDLVATNLLKTAEKAQLSFNVETNFTGKNIDDLEGSFSVDNLIYTKDDKEFSLNNLSFSATTKSKEKKELSIYSDYLNGKLLGRYSFATLPMQLHNIAHHYFPALVKEEKVEDETSEKKRKERAMVNDFTFDFSVDNLEPINEVFNLPFVVEEEAKIKGFFHENSQQFRVRVEAPVLRKGSSSCSDLLVLLENPQDRLKVLCRTTVLSKNQRRKPYYISLNTQSVKDDLDLRFSFSNSGENTYSGNLDLKALFKDFQKGEGVTADIEIKPTNFYLNDTIWNLRGSKVMIDKKVIEIDSLLLGHNSQFLCINGRNSYEANDRINVHFSDLQLGFFSDLLANKNISFNGVTGGDLYVYQLFKQPFFEGELYVYDGELNECVLGDLSVKAEWLKKEKCLDFDVDLLSPYKDRTQLSKSVIHGGVFFGNDSLHIAGDLKDVNMAFLRKYLQNVLQNNTGTVSGKVAAYGKFGDIGLEGTAYVKDMAFDVGYLNTSYVLSDSVKLTPHTIEVDQVQVFDTEGNYAIVSGMMLHDCFKNFKYAFDLKCDKLLALNTKEEDNDVFFGKAYAQGTANISGTVETVNINLAMKTLPNTFVTIPLEGTSSVKESSFVTFVETEQKKSMTELRKIRREKLKKIAEKKTSPTKMQLVMDLEATPDAEVHLIMDAQQGDIIRTKGAGTLHMTYNTRDEDFRMYGGYNIEKGDYLFTIQSVISRKFDIESGSSVRWTGDPVNADLNITAKYALNASLNDIVDDPNLRTNTSLVHCLLGLTGTISNPIIKFDIELPNSDDDVRSKLKSVINTEEEMNRNIASLLALGHFYSMDKTASSVATTELSSVGFSTLSSQLTNWISKINQDVSIGLNYRPSSTGLDGTVTSSEFDVALSTQFLNDRLLMNGNFGYRDEVTDMDNISNSIIDFDIEYKLNKSGKLRTKGFNRSNNSYFKQAPNTQGIGLVYREDFDTFSGLLKSYWDSLKRTFQRKEDEAEEKKEEDELKEEEVDMLNPGSE